MVCQKLRVADMLTARPEDSASVLLRSRRPATSLKGRSASQSAMAESFVVSSTPNPSRPITTGYRSRPSASGVTVFETSTTSLSLLTPEPDFHNLPMIKVVSGSNRLSPKLQNVSFTEDALPLNIKADSSSSPTLSKSIPDNTIMKRLFASNNSSRVGVGEDQSDVRVAPERVLKEALFKNGSRYDTRPNLGRFPSQQFSFIQQQTSGKKKR